MADAEFEAYLETRKQAQAYKREQDFKAFLKEREAGGAITAAPASAFRAPRYGAAVGGTLGVVAPMLAGVPEAAVIGGPVGAGLGEAGQQLYEVATGDPGAPESLGESMQRIGEEASLGMLGATGGRGAAIGVEKAVGAAPLRGMVSRDVLEVERFLQPYAPVPFLPSELTKGWKLDVVQNVAENSLIGGGAVRAFKEKRFHDVFQKVADELVDQFGPRMSAADAGRAVVDSLKYGREADKIPTSMIYNSIEKAAAPTYTPGATGMTVTVKEIDEAGKLTGAKVGTIQGERITSGARIDLRPMKTDIDDLVKLARETAGIEDRAMGNTLLEYVASRPDIISYPVAKQLRTQIRTLQGTLSGAPETKNAPGIGKAKLIYGKLTDAMEKGLTDYDPFLGEMWKEANFLERSSQLKFNNKIVSALWRKAMEEGGGKPEAIVDQIFKKNNISAINLLKNAVSPDAWKQMQSVGMQNLMSRWEKEGVLHPEALKEAAFGRTGLGEAEFAAAFGPQTAKDLKLFIRGLELQKYAIGPGTPGGMMVQMQQAGAVMAVAGGVMSELGLPFSGGLTGVGAMIMIAPWMMAKALTNPTMAKYLRQGLTLRPGTKEAAQVAGQLLTFWFPRPSEPEVETPMPSTRAVPQKMEK